MNRKINNICAEFCYEYIPAQIDESGHPQVLILNLPHQFKREVSRRLIEMDFFCSKTIPHGNSFIMQFKKVSMPAGK